MDNNTMEQYIKLLTVIINQNYFEQDKKLYKPKKDIATGFLIRHCHRNSPATFGTHKRKTLVRNRRNNIV